MTLFLLRRPQLLRLFTGFSGIVPANSDQVPKASQSLADPQTQSVVPHQTEETMEEEPALFVPSIGAWSKPLVLKFSPPCTPPEPSTPRSYDPQLVQGQIENFWPSLEESIIHKKKKSLQTVTPSPNLPVTKLPPTELKEDGSLCFLWAGRMNPATRNLYRASRPTFRLDGTPEIIIPTKDCVTPKVPVESIKANNIMSEMHDQAVDQFLGQELGPHKTVAISHKDSSTTFGQSLLDVKFALSSTLAGTSSAHTSPQVMDDVPSEIIMNE
ncbi:hypothetical protein HID58_083591, partial [Brassica napus]